MGVLSIVISIECTNVLQLSVPKMYLGNEREKNYQASPTHFSVTDKAVLPITNLESVNSLFCNLWLTRASGSCQFGI